MGAWRVDQHYGVGVANVRLHAEPYLHPERRWTLREGLDALREDLHDRDRSLRRAVGVLPGILLGTIVLLSFVLTVVRDRTDDTGVELVLWTSAPPQPEAIPEQAPPPIPIPKPVERAEPVEPPPLKPVAKPIAKPPPRPEPIRIAEAPPKPAPPPRAERLRRPPPRPAQQPSVRIDSLARAPVSPVPSRPTRGQAPKPPAERSQMEVLPIANRTPPRVEASSPEPRRFAAVRPPPSRKNSAPAVAPAIAALPRSPQPANRAPSERRKKPAAVSRTSRGAPPRPELAAPASIATDRASPDRPTRSARNAPTKVARGSSPRPDVRMAGVSHTTQSPASPSIAPMRSGVAPLRPSASRPVREEPGLAGVPLGSLASCLSDRQEDALKQRVVAAVRTQEQCVSRAGSYRFIETKNLNSFLMWVDRAPTRTHGDRCDELRLALECLASQ